ncbi:MAG: hypothetical protein COA49_00070 [Bacteroidetes bacterium]|nr:MAG: hypothetical protein COA49_00070 [Bacteroidota bacterium]
MKRNKNDKTMKQKLFYLIIGLLVTFSSGCKNDNNVNSDSKGKVELFLIDSFSKIDNSYQIDENSVITESSPLITYADFLSYDSTEYTFELSEKAKEIIKNLEHAVHGLAFAIKANDTLIYTGYFWPSYSSASCDWIVIDPLMTNVGDKISVRLGYPGLVQGQIIQDKRNDERIIEIFKHDNKLK